MAPPPAATIGRAAAREQMNTAVRLTSTTACHSATLSSSVGRRSAMPALLTRMSSRPKRAITRATAASTAASSLTSTCSTRCSTPSAASLPLAGASASASRSKRTGRTPSA